MSNRSRTVAEDLAVAAGGGGLGRPPGAKAPKARAIGLRRAHPRILAPPRSVVAFHIHAPTFGSIGHGRCERRTSVGATTRPGRCLSAAKDRRG